jgi:hypothetical protein
LIGILMKTPKITYMIWMSMIMISMAIITKKPSRR